MPWQESLAVNSRVGKASRKFPHEPFSTSVVFMRTASRPLRGLSGLVLADAPTMAPAMTIHAQILDFIKSLRADMAMAWGRLSPSVRPDAHCSRRGGVGARRVYPGLDRQRTSSPSAGISPLISVHLSRHEGRRAPGHPHSRDVCGQAR